MFRKIPLKADISLILVATIGLGLSLTAFFYVKQWELEQTIEEQRKQANEHVRVLRQTFTTFGNILNSIRGLHHVHHYITRKNFNQFVKSDLLTQPGIQALEWVPVVPNFERQRVEAKAKREGIHQFHFWEFTSRGTKRIADERSIYYPVLFSESLLGHSETLGYDLGSNETLRIALESARETGVLTTSGAIKIWSANSNKEELGFYIFLPVYHDESIPDSVEERQQKIVGFAVGVFLFNNLVESVLRLPKQRNTSEVFLRIFDDTLEATIQQLYIQAAYRDELGHLKDDLGTVTEVLSIPVEFGARTWRITFSKVDEFSKFYIFRYAWTVLGIGLVFTLGLLRYMYIILTHAHWAEELVARRTQSLSEANQALNKEIKAREQMTKALEASRQRFQAIFNEAAIGIAQINLNDQILDSNRALQTLLRYREDELQNQFLRDLAHPEDADADKIHLEKMLSGRYDTYQVSKRYICKSGAIVWTNQSCSIVRDTTHPFIISMIEDITERTLAEEARLEAENRYRDIFENAIEGIFQCTPNGHYLSVNPAFVRIFGYDSAEQVYVEITDIGQQIYVDPQRRLEFLQLLETHSNVQDFEYQARCRDNKVIWVNETVRVVRDKEQKILYYEGIVEDVTQRKLTEEKLRHDATHDQLTGLLNRSAFTKHLTQALEKLNDNNDSVSLSVIAFAVLFVDLDRFKIVNDSMGHLVGDQLLTEIAHRLDNDICNIDVVARFGGDEFALMLENVPDLPCLEKRIDCIQQQLSEPYILKNETFNTTASIGIALSHSRYNSADEILRDADTAMYEAKQSGRGKYLIFQPGMHTHVVNLLRMESDLRRALERDEFRVYYQPIISLENLHTVSLEALVRWEHPELGLVSPDKFIPISEETGLIKDLGLWVFETACQQLCQWQTLFVNHINLGMNINVSPIQLKQPRLVREVQDIIEKSKIKGHHCRIEITEGAMMQDPEAALKVFNDLKNLEVLLYVDDFGTGYSSLSYLQKFPIDALKIDKSFIREIDGSSRSAQIAQAIIALGQAFDLRIVAEGVENNFQATMLKAAHCHHVQGYLFSRPKNSQEIEHFLRFESEEIAKSLN